MRFDIITIFPEIFREVFDFGIVRRAVEARLIEIQIHDLRDYTFDRHHQVDDRPFGGGAGMVMKPEPLFRAVEAPRGRRVQWPALAAGSVVQSVTGAGVRSKVGLILICGRYEGVDERVVEHLITDECAIGDYVLSGGEIPAMVWRCGNHCSRARMR
jgi:tRNA (guanine37-N1)-methyltransferase